MDYDAAEHIHRYAVWTAARAQRAFLTNELINDAINKVRLKEECQDLKNWNTITVSEFDNWHSRKCNELVNILKFIKSGEVYFGRSAKIVNIYLKTSVVIGGCATDCSLTNIIHPPIDKILLTNLISKDKISGKYLKVAWTKMGEEIYKEIIKEIREEFPALWKVEEYWNIKDENESKN